MNFDVQTEKVDDSTYVIALGGEVDLYTAPEFKQQLLHVIAKGAKDVVVDFTRTTFSIVLSLKSSALSWANAASRFGPTVPRD